MIMEQDGRQLSETKTQTGRHVLVDYCGASGGDFLRYFISLHEGFQKITWNKKVYDYWKNKNLLKLKPTPSLITHPSVFNIPFHNVKCEPENKIYFSKLKEYTLENFYLHFKESMPNEDKYRQCYKIMTYKDGDSQATIPATYGHSCVGATYLADGDIIRGKPFKWDFSEYELLRQTNHKIIFVIVNPFSKYKDFYLKRHKLWAGNNVDYNEKVHEATWKKNYLNKKYPKHELNYELEIYDLFDKDDKTYYDMIKFLNVNPINDWKNYIEEYKQFVQIS